MVSKFIYCCKLAGSTTDVYLTDLDMVKEMWQEGAIVTCKKYEGEI